MALRITRSPRSLVDLREIWDFIAEIDESAADRVLERIDAVVALLADNPFAGRSRPELHHEVRSFPAGRFMIFYRVLPDALAILRVFHGSRDISASTFN